MYFCKKNTKTFFTHDSWPHQRHNSRYFQAQTDDVKKLVPEGIVGQVPYKGLVGEELYQLVGGLRASMGYCGAESISELQKASFIRITSAGVRESHPHDVAIVKEAPNYHRWFLGRIKSGQGFLSSDFLEINNA